MILDKSAILSANDSLIIGPIHIPEWGGDVYLRCMSGAERDAFESEQWITKGKDIQYNKVNMRARLLVRCICDASGARLFADGDAAQLGAKNCKSLERLFDKATKHNLISESDVEEMTKNSPEQGEQSGDSISISA